MSDCKWIVFDAVGTLINPDPTVATAYHQIGTRYGSQISVAEIGQRFRTAFHGSERDGFPGGPSVAEHWKTSDPIEVARWRWIVRQVLPDVHDPEGCFRDLWDHFARPSSWRCFSDVGDSLLQISRAGYRLAIASNFDGRLHSVCDALSDLSMIEHRIVSATIGCRKPAPEFYAAIIQACHCEPHQILMIGDNHDCDVRGPRQAGLKALHLDRSLAVGSENQLTSLTELVTRLAG